MSVTAPWMALPRAFAVEVRKERSGLSSEIVHEIRRSIPEFGRPLAGRYGATIQLGVETALQEFPELVEGTGEPTPERLQVYRRIGRGELVEGRSLEALQAAYRLGGRVAWRRYARVGRRTGMRPDELVTLAEAIFAHIDLMVTASAAGYEQARSGRADRQGVTERRQHLRDLLIAGAPEVRLRAAAAAADWPLPGHVSCAALGPAPQPRRPGADSGRRLPDPVLCDLDRSDPFVILRSPAEDLRNAALQTLLRERGAVVGPAVAPGMTSESLRWARMVRSRLGARVREGGLVMCDQALPSLLLAGDEPLVRLLGERRLSALESLTPRQRVRVEETALAWLETNRGSAPQVASRLGIHPQTARQRLRRLHELFGAPLTDPAARFEFELALRGRHALDAFQNVGAVPAPVLRRGRDAV